MIFPANKAFRFLPRMGKFIDARVWYPVTHEFCFMQEITAEQINKLYLEDQEQGRDIKWLKAKKIMPNCYAVRDEEMIISQTDDSHLKKLYLHPVPYRWMRVVLRYFPPMIEK